jgi:hypothetical protein
MKDGLHVGFTPIRHLSRRTTQRKEATKMKTRKKWLIATLTAAMLAVGALGSMSVFAATEPPATEAAEAAETSAPEQAEPNEPALPGGGYADSDGVNADTQFEGIQ